SRTEPAAKVIAVVRAVAVVAAALALTATARAGIVVGVNDDAGKNPGQSGWFYPALAAEGLRDDAIVLRWDDTAPTTVPDVANATRALTLAAANGATVELDLFPLHSQVFTGGTACASTSDPESCGDTTKLGQFA